MSMPRPPSSKSTFWPLRAMKLVGGFALLIVGGVLAIPGVPGPGIPIILLGLLVLSDHFAWARRAIVWVKVRTARFRRTGNEGACSR
jgi:putative transmembrane protein PGPGW